MRRGAAGSHVDGAPCHAGPGRDTDTGLTDGQHALQRGAEGPAPKGRTARSTKTGSMGDGPRELEDACHVQDEQAVQCLD